MGAAVSSAAATPVGFSDQSAPLDRSIARRLGQTLIRLGATNLGPRPTQRRRRAAHVRSALGSGRHLPKSTSAMASRHPTSSCRLGSTAGQQRQADGDGQAVEHVSCRLFELPIPTVPNSYSSAHLPSGKPSEPTEFSQCDGPRIPVRPGFLRHRRRADAARFGDAGANTLGHIAEACAAGTGDRDGLRARTARKCRT